jgi:hypothetical protein
LPGLVERRVELDAQAINDACRAGRARLAGRHIGN